MHVQQYALCHCLLGTFSADHWVIKQDEGVYVFITAGNEVHGDVSRHVVVLNTALHYIFNFIKNHTTILEQSIVQQFVGVKYISEDYKASVCPGKGQKKSANSVAYAADLQPDLKEVP